MEKLYRGLFQSKSELAQQEQAYLTKIKELEQQIELQSKDIELLTNRLVVSQNREVLFTNANETVLGLLRVSNNKRDNYKLGVHILGLINIATLVLLVANVIINNC